MFEHSFPRMRTITEAASEIRAQDPNTAVTPYRIRQLILTGSLPSVRAGNKYLIDLDILLDYLKNPQSDRFKQTTAENEAGKIRRIEP